MYYVYIIQSKQDKSHYVGISENLVQRLNEHNDGKVRYTSSRKPYTLVWYCAFRSKRKALVFKKYLKQGSGFAFARKRLI